jgi:hypothetical protein
VVEEIVACRERRGSPAIAGLDYAQAPFGGPFGSWSQFNQFVDALVAGGVLKETRTELYWDYDDGGGAVRGSARQLRAASQAIGDVLKANFNPNLHLNELNPDRALFTLVDKTDLVVNSTEFCFTPMGTFEIESRGRIVRPAAGDDHETLASATSAALVKIFDAVRHTSQAHFAGTFAPRRAGPETNNNRSLESGPEPDNGPAPSENRWDGYLQLPTYGSNFAKGEQKPPGELWTTLTDASFYPGVTTSAPGGPHLGSSLHAHFHLDHAAHHHGGRNGSTSPPDWDGFRLPVGAWQTVFGRRCCLNRNWEDRSETLPSPYSPVEGARAGQPGRHRLVRSFSGPAPEGVEAAPSDLRIDGAYVERDSSFGYWMEENESFNFNEGTAACWIKPAFAPEQTGKRRTLLSMSRYHAHAAEVMNPSPFALFFVPPQGDGPSIPSYAGGLTTFPPSSLAFGFGFSGATGYTWELPGQGEDKAAGHAFAFTPTLEGVLRANEWSHVAVTWDIPRNRLPNADSVKIYVNGRVLPGSAGMPHLFAQEGQPFRNTPWWSVHSLQAVLPGLAGPRWVKNSIRLGGEPSRLFDLPGDGAAFPANFTADATIDEFYLWRDRSPRYNGGLWGLQTIWNRGRYYRPDDRDPQDARFLSAPLEFRLPQVREPAPPAGSPAPPAAAPGLRVLGLSWTALGGAMDFWVEADEASHGPYRNPAFSPVRDTAGRPLSAAAVRYAVKFMAGSARTLLATPVLDDVTVYYDSGKPEFLGWVTP